MGWIKTTVTHNYKEEDQKIIRSLRIQAVLDSSILLFTRHYSIIKARKG